MKKVLLLMLGILIALPAFARDFDYTYEGQTITYTVIDEKNKTVETKAGTFYEPGKWVTGALVLPEHPMDLKNGVEYTLTSFGYGAFQGCICLTSVTIPNSMTSIGSCTFSNCTGLTSVTIPNSVTEIGFNAFEKCSGLTSVTIPNSVTEIGSDAFSGCSGLTSVTIPNSVTEIGFNAFSDCTGLTSVTIPNSVTEIGFNAFSDCTGLTSVTIGNSVTSIGNCTFLGCSSLTSVIIPTSVTEIGLDAFSGCSGLIKSVYPSTISSNPFPAGIAVQYPTEGAIIEDGLVWGPDKSAIYFAPLDLSGEFVVPTSVTSIGDNTFYNCSGLTSVTIPTSVTSIGSDAFKNCTGMTKAEFASIESLCAIKFGNCNSNPLYNAHNLYIDGEEVTEMEISNSVTSIGSCAFAGCTGLTSMIIPNSVTSIGSSAFSDCKIKKYAYPSSLSEPDINGIGVCYDAIDSRIEDGIIYTRKKDKIYFVSTSFKGSLTLPESVKKILDYAFAYCDDLTSVTIPNSVTSIYKHTFIDCSGLTSLTLSKDLRSIGAGAFTGCKAIMEVTNPTATPIDAPADIFEPTVYDNAILHVPAGSVKLYESKVPWSYFYNIDGFEIMVESISLDKASVTLKVAESITLTPTILPEDATDKTVTWESSDSDIATVDANGKVTAIAVGEAVITASCGDVSATCTVTVVPTPVESVSLNQTSASLKVGESVTLTATVSPEDATDKTVTWESSNSDIATVDATGKVTAIAVGEAVITASCGDVSATCTVTVIPSSGIDDILCDPNGRYDIYNLQGICIKRNATREDIDALRPGFYFIGGEKVMITAR